MGELEGFYALWYREMKVFSREKSRIVSSLITPLLWIVVFGGGLGSAVSLGGVNYQVFIFPGILAMSILFSSVFFGLYIVWDRKIDFFKEVLVAPLSRTTIFAGKMVGGSIDALLQGCAMLVFGLVLGINYTILSVLFSFVFMFVLALGARKPRLNHRVEHGERRRFPIDCELSGLSNVLLQRRPLPTQKPATIPANLHNPRPSHLRRRRTTRPNPRLLPTPHRTQPPNPDRLRGRDDRNRHMELQTAEIENEQHHRLHGL